MNYTKTCSVCQETFPATTEYFHQKHTGKYGLVAKCKKCMQIYNLESYQKHRQQRLMYKKIEAALYPEKIKQRQKEQYIKHKAKRLLDVKNYQEKNKDKIRKRTSNYTLNRYHSDMSFKLKMNLSRRMRQFINKNGKNTIELLGCSIDEFKIHIESLFNDGMSWDNYGRNGWHIDHILPCTSFDLTDPIQQKKCFHYTNLQPLWAIDNIRKSNKVVDN